MPTPIAIVSRSCIFPGSLSPQALWKNLLESRDLLSAPDKTRWRTDPGGAMGKQGWNNPGGYVQGFDEIFAPHGFELDAATIESLDPLFHWVLHTAQTAYSAINQADQGKLSILLGNLSLPSEGLATWTEAVWGGEKLPHRFNRFMSGLPAHLVASALGRKADAMSLDAACASSIYAIKLGCEKLRENRADIVLAGAVNRADPLFLNIGFQALQALSPTGRSRPFHHKADGLVPAEGAAFIGLKRLDDAIDCRDEILGVIHDAGLSNDGRSDGLLVPAGEGQVRSIQAAYDHIDVEPEEISFVECHATGTPVGDGREIKSLGEVFNQDHEIAIGSHKSNMGHAITAAGMAGLMKILGAFEHNTIPPTIHCDEPIDVLQDSPFRLVTEAQPWEDERKIAALSAFGFGGNNSHLVVEKWRGDRQVFVGADLESPSQKHEVAVVGLAVQSGYASSLADFEQALLKGRPEADEYGLDQIELPLDDLRFPPRDLQESLPQQVAILRAAMDAVAQSGADGLPRETTGVFAGMQTDPAIVRHGLRARLHDRPDAQDAVADPLTAAAVIGSLPNIVANRINAHFDLGGFSFATSAEEQSGDVALREACQAIGRGDLDAAIACAVEMSCCAAHTRAVDSSEPPADAAVCLVLKRRSLAEDDGDTILATIDDAGHIGEADAPTTTPDLPDAHSATGLLQTAAAIAVPEFALPRTGDATGIRKQTTIATTAIEAPGRNTTLTRNARPVFTDTPKVHRITIDAVEATVVADGRGELDEKRRNLESHLSTGAALAAGIYLKDHTVKGEIAQVFTGAAAAYHGMGRPLCLAFPDLVDDFSARFAGLDVATRWMFHPDAGASPTPLDKLFASSVLSQLHSDFATGVLGIDFDCAIGFSSGETNALFATGVWRDFDGMLSEFADSGAFSKALGGSFELLSEVWADDLDDDERPDWQTWRVTGPRDEVDEAIANEPLVYLLLINAPDDVSIGGHAPAVRRVLDDLSNHATSYLDYDIAVHCPALEAFEETWLDVHTRPNHDTDVRLYSHAFVDSFEPTSKRVAQALYGQATNTVDFPALIEKAYDDGVRLFVEHGPRKTLSPWIQKILADRPHKVVSLDVGSTDTLRPLAHAMAELDAAGVDVDVEAYNDQLDAHSHDVEEKTGRTVSFAAHHEPIEILDESMSDDDVFVLPQAPPLPSPLTNTDKRQSNRQRRGAGSPGASSRAVQRDSISPGPRARGSQWSDNQPSSNLPEYFHLQKQAFDRYLDVVDTQTEVHRQFLARTKRAWDLYNDAPPSPLRGSGRTQRSEERSMGGLGNSSDQNNTPHPPSVSQTALDTSPHAGREKRPQPTGPTFTRQDLEIHASGNISEIFGPKFARQDDFPRQVRMPEPPLLLADRVTGIDAEPGVVSTGTVWTETDINPDSWYLFNRHIPPGVMIEAGQADLFLISWMGADFANEGERIYRLLGCELTYQKGLPKAGDTLKYDIHIDGHAKQGDVRLFFFHYDLRVDGDIRLSVREGQAGFFTDEELADSMGILWTPEDAEFRDDATLDPPRVDADLIPESLDKEDVLAFADGDTTCFGEGYERLLTHTRTPNIDHGDMCLVGDVQEINVDGGPTGRGYMRTVYEITPQSWFFDGHFKDDPCMPGTLMFEGGMQVMSLYMIAVGLTLDRDGWRFEPVADVAFDLRCRGQATPQNEKLVYEIFVEEVIADGRPTLVADILATVDGLKAFHCRGMQMQLVPDTPLTEQLIVDGEGERNDERALREGELVHDKLAVLATSCGPASLCLGPKFQPFDGERRMPRLPGEPFQFMTRITEASATAGDARPGDHAVVEYDIPDDYWYFEASGRPTMPYAVIVEAALQPCGWLSLYSGAILESDEPLFYRNLDGKATLYREIRPDDGVLTTHTTLTRDSASGGMTIQSFEVQCTIDDELVYEVETTFGFFPKEALQDQVGLPIADGEQQRLGAASDFNADLSCAPDADHAALWPDDQLRMIDRVSGRWQGDDSTYFRAEKDVDPSEWFFKAHFYQDPVMPGSLGVESMLQTLRFALIDGGYHQRFEDPKIEPVAIGDEISWTYRGQVLPEANKVTVLLELEDVDEEDDQTTALAHASLWVDGLKIYGADSLVMRIC